MADPDPVIKVPPKSVLDAEKGCRLVDDAEAARRLRQAIKELETVWVDMY